MPKGKTDKPFNFEKSLNELEKIVDVMEAGDLPLDKSLEKFECGVALVKDCQKALETAEQKVQILTEKAGKETLEPFEDLDDFDDA